MRSPLRTIALGLTATVALLAWVDREEALVAKRRNFWSLQKPVRAEVPATPNAWVRTPVDAFLLEAMQQKGLTPSAPLDRQRLIRRVTLDMTGLPPTPAEVAAFVNDHAPQAYERLVDRLLASPHYGERWAQKWLDVVRWAETNGYELDAERPHAWRYRDYVVRSFNADKPYDRFVKEQIAGDELYPGDHEALIATGMHRAGPQHVVGGNQDEEMNRQEVLTEMTNNIGSAFLGLTIGCARCHNHKFDPILQADHYRVQSFFAATDYKDIVIATEQQQKEYEAAKAAYEAKLKPIKDAISEIEKPYKERLRAEKKAKLEKQFKEALDTPEEQRTDEQKRLAKEAKQQIDPLWDEVLALVPPDEKVKRAALRRQMHQIELYEPEPPATVHAVENRKDAPPTHILKVGDHKQKLDVVEPGFLKVLAPTSNVTKGPVGRRSALAEWLTSPDHALTARVMVNRIWQFRMGTGIVGTPNDFGTLGQRPTNQKLLDWLATEFVAQGWSIKKLDRMILLSSAYQQQTAYDAAKAQIDPDNKLYWRANRRRLEGEMVRDSLLVVSGKFNPQREGRSVRVPIEQEVYDLIFTEYETDNLWPVTPDASQHNRRTLYLVNKRNVRLPLLFNFDQPDTMTSCPIRPASTHALQSLSMMNSDFMQEQSKAFAQRLATACGPNNRACQVQQAYRIALARAPRPAESKMAQEFFARKAPLQDFCLALLNRNEFLYLP